MTRGDAFLNVSTERDRQDEIWPQTDHPREKWLCILMEEVGEVAVAMNDDDDAHILVELSHVAAVAIRMMEVLDPEEELIVQWK